MSVVWEEICTENTICYDNGSLMSPSLCTVPAAATSHNFTSSSIQTISTQHIQIYTFSPSLLPSPTSSLFFLSLSLLPNTQSLLRFTTFLPKDQQPIVSNITNAPPLLWFGTRVWDSQRPALMGSVILVQSIPWTPAATGWNKTLGPHLPVFLLWDYPRCTTALAMATLSLMDLIKCSQKTVTASKLLSRIQVTFRGQLCHVTAFRTAKRALPTLVCL